MPDTDVRRGAVLVVDDDESVGAVLRRALGRRHHVVVVTSAEAGVAALGAGERFDVILCDINMPDMGGLELREVLERIAPDQAGRIVFMSGGGGSGTVGAMAAVPNRCIEKPFDLAALRQLVDELVR